MFTRIRKMLPVFAALSAFAGLVPNLFAEAPSRLVDTTQVPGSVRQVLSHLKKSVAGNGMMIMGELHQGRIMGMTGLRIKSETVFVGNPNVGKKLFSADAGVGVVVPVRINIFRDADGKTEVSYIPPSKVLDGFDNPKIRKIAEMFDAKLHKMVTALSE